MDALSEALTSVRMTGAIFYRAECTAPWGLRVPHLQCFAGEEDIAVTAGIS